MKIRSVVAGIAVGGVLSLALVGAPSAASAAADPDLASASQNLGGSAQGTYVDSAGHTYDGSGTAVVVIDGAFKDQDANLAGKVAWEACFGQTSGSWLSLCAGGSTVNRSARYPGSGLAENTFQLATGSGGSGVANASDGRAPGASAPTNVCRDPGKPAEFCHYFHGTATAGTAAGNSRMRGANPYGGVAPGAKLVLMKVGGGTGSSLGWSYQNVLNALLETKRLVDSPPAQLANTPIAAVSISSSGGSWTGNTTCAPGSVGEQIGKVVVQLQNKNVPVIFASGNEGYDDGSSSWICDPAVLHAGATEVTSKTSPTPYSNVYPGSLYAPVGDGSSWTSGNAIVTAYPGGSFFPRGTSFATPQIAGAFAVLAQKYGTSAWASNLNRLRTSGAPLTGSRAAADPAGRVINIKAALG